MKSNGIFFGFIGINDVRAYKIINLSIYGVRARRNGIVPFFMKGVSVDVEGVHLIVGNLDPLGIIVFVENGMNDKPLARSGIGDQVDDDLVACEWDPLPVHADVGEAPMLDFVPFRGSLREVAHPDRSVDLVGKHLQLLLPEAGAPSVAASPVGSHHDLLAVGIALLPLHVPPSPEAFHGKGTRIVVRSHVDPSFVLLKVVDAVGRNLAQRFVREVVILDLHGTFLGFPRSDRRSCSFRSIPSSLCRRRGPGCRRPSPFRLGR